MSNWQVICGCVGAVLGWWVGAAEQGHGPYVAIGRWRNEQVANKTLRLLHRVMFECAPDLCTPECWE